MTAGATYAVLAGGGTGGHVYPALALADELVARGHPKASVRFVGGRRGLEGGVVAEAGYHIDLLPGRGLQRRVTLANVAAVWGAVVAVARAWRIVRRSRPRVVVGFGGYASLPTVAAARLSRLPAVIHEQDAVPGLANRIGMRLGARAATSLPGTAIPGARLTGNPVRAAVAGAERRPADPPLVAVFGGSLGARSINRAAVGLYDRWRDRSDVALRHVTGPRDFDECARALDGIRRPGDRLDHTMVPYEDHMELLLGRAALAVCRAGAGAVAELTAVGVPSVLVPLPGSPGDHQGRNAAALADAGAAVVLPDADCDPERLDAVAGGLVSDPGARQRMAEAARALGHPDAAARLADLVEEVAGG